MRQPRRLAVVLVPLAMVAACGDDGSGAPAAASGNADIATFCDAWNLAVASGNDSAIDEVLADAPSDIAGAARIVREVEASEEGSREADAAEAEVLDWTELNCRRIAPGASARRVAPPIDATFDGLTFCGTTAFPGPSPRGTAGMVLYGEAAASDPYDGPMLGLLWNPVDDGTHTGDGAAQHVTVRGQRGVAAPITVFQQVILPNLGTVIAWTEGDRAFGLYGREWPIDRASELVDIANVIEEVAGESRIPSEGLPEGYEEVFVGDPSVTSLLLAPSPLYSLRYEGSDGLLDVYGLQMSEEEFEAFRFFTIGVDQAEAAGHDALVGNAWHADSPAVVTWRDADGLVVRIVGIGVPLATAREMAEQSRELSDDEWTALVEAEDRCEGG